MCLNQTAADFSAQKFVDDLLSEGSKIPCDDSLETFNNNEQLPTFYNGNLYRKGCDFFYKHMFAFMSSKFHGLLIVLSVPSILNLLIDTKMSSTDLSAYKRYTRTLFHTLIWYESDFKPGSRLWTSINEVKWHHNVASKKRRAQGKTCINQKDMALTQFGFLGFALVRSRICGIHEASEDEWRAIVHIWRVIGSLMGIQDRFNIFRESLEETKEISNILIDQVYRRQIEEKSEDFLKMCQHFCNGIWPVIPYYKHKSIMCVTHLLVQNEGHANKDPVYFDLNNSEKNNYYFLLYCANITQNNIVRLLLNALIRFNMWLAKVFPIFAYIQLGFRDAQYRPIKAFSVYDN